MHNDSLANRHNGDMTDSSTGLYARVMLVEDDTKLASLTAAYLSAREFIVAIEHDGTDALTRIVIEKPDLIILDVMLPGTDGFDICRKLRARGNTTPVLMLTARDEDIDQVLGLELGADDYLTKPVQPRVLLAHIKAILRRSADAHGVHSASARDNARPNDKLVFGRLHIGFQTREAMLGKKRMNLTVAEFDLLWLLASNAGRVLPRAEILRTLRGLEYDGFDRSIDSRMSRLRKKLGDDIDNAHIKTIRPQGYLFSPADW